MCTIGTNGPWVLSDSTKVGTRCIDTSLTKAMIITGLALINILASTTAATGGKKSHTRSVHCHSGVSITIETILADAIVALVGLMVWHAHGKGITLGISAHLALVFDVLTNVTAESVDTLGTE